MTEQEPVDIKDDTENLDEIGLVHGSEENRQCLTNIRGHIFRAHRFGIYASFDHNNKSEMAVLFPGKGFVNGTLLLGDMFKTDQELSLLFPAGKEVFMDLVSQVSRLVPESGSSLNLVGKSETTEKSEERKCGWVVSALWFNSVDAKPDLEKLKTGTSFTDEALSISKCADHISDNVMLEDEQVSGVDEELYSWFVVTIMMPRANTAMPHPDLASCKGVSGRITALHNPHGGIVQCGDDEVFFHRSRVFINEVHLSITVTLETSLSLGMEVLVDYISPEENLFDECSHNKIALLLYTGKRPSLSKLRHAPFPLAEDDQNKYLVAKIITFDPPGPHGIESGVAEILKPTELNTLAFTKNSFKRYVDVESNVRFVKFHRENMFHLGTLLHKSDLQYFFSSSCFGMSIFFCYAVPLSNGSYTRKALDQDIEIAHEVSLGWKGSVSFLHATGQGGLTLTPNTKEDTLLYPRVFSFQSTKFLGREGMKIAAYEVGAVDSTRIFSKLQCMNFLLGYFVDFFLL